MTCSIDKVILTSVPFVEVNRLSYIIWSYQEEVTRVLFFPSLQLPNRIWSPMAVLSDGRTSYWGNRWTMNGDNDKSIISVTWWWQIDHIGHVVIMTNRSYQSRGDDKSIISVTWWWWQIYHISHVVMTNRSHQSRLSATDYYINLFA